MTPEPYEILARVYDRWVGSQSYEGMLRFLEEHAAPRSAAPRALDLCCGTGTLALELAGRGYHVVGLDRSAAMLKLADEKLAQAGLAHRVRLRSADARTEDWPDGAFDLVLCTFDSINYFSPAELGPLLERAAARLAPGGALVFDINSEHKLRAVFGDTIYAETQPDYCYIWKNELDEAAGAIRYHISLFLREPAGALYRRHDELHQQYIHRHTDVLQRLERCGLRRVIAREDYGAADVGASSLRITYAAWA